MLSFILLMDLHENSVTRAFKFDSQILLLKVLATMAGKRQTIHVVFFNRK